MKYYTWKIDWSNGEGTDPTSTINSDLVRIEPQFATGDLDNPNTLIYAILSKGEIDLTQLKDWSVEETTSEEMLLAAQVIDADAILINGFVRFSKLEMERI